MSCKILNWRIHNFASLAKLKYFWFGEFFLFAERTSFVVKRTRSMLSFYGARGGGKGGVVVLLIRHITINLH